MDGDEQVTGTRRPTETVVQHIGGRYLGSFPLRVKEVASGHPQRKISGGHKGRVSL